MGPPGLVVSGYTVDRTNAELLYFTLDLELDQIQLTFSKAIDFGSFKPRGISLQSTQNITENGTLIVTLSDSKSSKGYGNELIISLSRDDIDAIKSSPYGTDVDNTFITISPDTVVDATIMKNNISGIYSLNAFPANAVINDTSGPILESFELDLDNGELRVTFSEPISHESFNFSGFVLQSSPGSLMTYPLTGGEIKDSDDLVGTSELTIILDDSDIQYIKFNSSFGN